MRARIGIDVDGVLADMTGYVLRAVNYLRGKRGLPPRTVADVTEWDYRNLFGDDPGADADNATLWRCLKAPYVAAAFQPFPHALALLQRLGELGDVWLVTSPMPGSDSWAGERIRWAQERLGVDRHRVAIMADKSAFDGRVLIDDRAQNLLEWEDGGELRRGILWRQPYSGVWRGWWTQSVEGAVEAVRYELTDRPWRATGSPREW